MKIRFRILTLWTVVCLTFPMSGCDFIYGILQKEGAQEKKLLGEVLPFTYNKKVEEVQSFLKLYGYNVGSIDGKFGPKTREAIEAFQKDQGLKTTRFVDKKTWERLSIFKITGLIKDGEVDLKTVQIALSNAGYDCGKVDGILGPKTAGVLKEFQKAHNLKPDAVIGLKTLLALKDYLLE